MRAGNFMGGTGMQIETKINTIVGCIMASALDNETKRELIDFMWELEEADENERETESNG